MKSSVRALKTSALSERVASQLDSWVAHCNGSWWRRSIRSEPPHTIWRPVEPLQLLARVKAAAQEQVAGQGWYDDPDYATLVAELGNVRSFLMFLALLKLQLAAEGLES